MLRFLKTATALALILSTSCASRVKVVDLPAPLSSPESALTETQESWKQITNGDRSAESLESYNDSVAKVVQHLKIPQQPTNGDATVGNSFHFSLGSQSIPVVDHTENLTEFNSIEAIKPADLMVIKGFRERVQEEGIGAPVVMRFPSEGYSPEEGRFLPATAILSFDGPHQAPRLHIHDTLAPVSAVSATPFGPLHKDFTAPLARRFAAEDYQRINLPAMLQSNKFDDKLGLSQLDVTYPKKIPVVFVHGLKSTPIIWRDVMNELRADPVVRDRYEFWTFGYTTGAPIPYSAMKLREALKGMATYRELQGATTDDVVLVSHSMGGLLSRLVTEKSGDDVWYQYFNEPVDELPLPEEERELMRKMAYFEPLPFIHRVVFIATPHGGSEIAENSIGRLFSGLIQLPNQLLTLSTTVFSDSLSMLTPLGIKLVSQRLPTSIDQLEMSSEFLQTLKAKPLNPNVTFHSIIGDQGQGIGPGSTDGVVPYTSSHLEGAVSEKIVPAPHKAYDHPEAIAEIARILRLHAGQP